MNDLEKDFQQFADKISLSDKERLEVQMLVGHTIMLHQKLTEHMGEIGIKLCMMAAYVTMKTYTHAAQETIREAQKEASAESN